MGTFHRIDSCRVCGNRELEPILSLGNQYLTGIFPRTPDEPLTCGPLSLIRCVSAAGNSCGLVQLEHSYASGEMYGDRYGYRSSLNRSMVSHLESKVARLVDVADLRDGDVVLDIGSNDGTTLSFYPESVTRVGMDPTAAKFLSYYPAGVRAIPDFFSAEKFDTHAGGAKAKIVTSIAMFYDLDDPLSFVRQVEQVLHDDGIWHFEQSYLPTMLVNNGYDTICHEHVEYYSLSQIDWMLQRAGLRIIDVELNEINGGSFAVSACKSSSNRFPTTDASQRILMRERREHLDQPLPYSQFASRVNRHREELRELLQTLKRQNRLTLGYGASTKGNVMLQFCGVTPDEIPFIAEVNEDKFGAYTPGTGIPIISERQAHAMRPEFFLAMPWHFRDDLLAREKSFVDGGGKMIFPLPTIDIVSRGVS